VVEAVSDAYLAATQQQRKALVGQPLLATALASPRTAHNLQASFAQVLDRGNPHELVRQLFHVPDPAGPGLYLERSFRVLNTPVVDEDGYVTGIIHALHDTTEQTLTKAQLRASQEREHVAQVQVAVHAEALAAVQRQLHAREAFYQLFTHTPAAVCILRGPDHRFEYVNPVYQQFFADRALLGQPIAQALPEAAPAGVLSILDSVYRTGEPFFGLDIPLRMAQPDDSPNRQRYFTFTFQAYREAGAVVGVSTYAFEVTAQVLANQQRRVQQQQQRDLFEQAPLAIAICRGPAHELEIVNPLMGELWHLPPAELLGRPLFEALPQLESQGVLAILHEVAATGVPRRVREWSVPPVSPTGTTRFFNGVYQPLRDARGQVDAIAFVATDVTQQVLARQASENAARHIRTLTDALPALIARVDCDERYTFANKAYERWYGQPATDLVGRSVRSIIGEVAYQRGQAIRGRAQAGERVEFDATNRRDGGFQHVHGNLIPDVQNGQVTGYFILITDVTGLVEARRAAETSAQQVQDLVGELQQANEELTRANIDLDNFFYMASHDLQGPLTNVEGLLQALDEELPAEVTFLLPVAQVLSMLRQTVNGFQLTLSQMTDAVQQHPLQLVASSDIAALVEAVRLDLAPLLSQAPAHLHLDIAGSPSIPLSPSRLRSLLYNLLSNALKYRHPDRPALVELRIYRDSPQVIVEVHDNGLGLTERQQKQLFSRYTRLHPHVTGSGVGLFMIKRMVENVGGSITVQSKPGVGSCFRVSLPLE